ncbi:MAG: hypothetical protein K2Q26_12560 [Bdellovibrionales bacterium]|nr:hypothetical protein [Bdellovibrionales bacterium]
MLRIYVLMVGLTLSPSLFADLNYRSTTRIGNPDLYDLNFGRESRLQDYKVVDLSASVNVGSNCGQMDVGANLRSNLKEFLNGDFFQGVGNQIVDAGGLLALCYLSPAMCSITKNLRLESGLTSAMDLDACSMIEKYQDQQIAVYERERSQCMRRELQRNGNNVKLALKTCGGNNYEHNLADWSGGDKNVNLNRLIESTAKWAGLKGDDAERTIELTKAFVGDTVIGRGGVEVDFGARKRIVSPSEIIEEEKVLLAKGLNSLFKDYDENWHIKDDEIKKIFEDRLPLPVARNLVQKLSFLPHQEREMAIHKLSKSVATQSGVDKVEKSMEILLLASRNPNIPDAQKLEAKQLGEQLKDSLELGVHAKSKEYAGLERVVSQITTEGQKYEDWENQDLIGVEKANFSRKSLQQEYMDCSDKVFCAEVSNVLD